MEIRVKDGQTLFDIALQVYGDISGYWWILQDNNLTVESEVSAGQVLKIRANFLKDKALFFRNAGREINNSDNFRFSEKQPISIHVVQVKNEVYGNDGYVRIEVIGGKPPYFFLWSNGATTKNLLNAGAGFYALIVEDSKGDQATLNISIGTDNTGNWLAEKKTGLFILTKAGSKIRLKV